MVRVHPSLRKTTTKTLWKSVIEELQKAGPKTRQSKEYSHLKCILFPDDTFNEYWGIVMSLLLLYTCTVSTYRICLIDLDATIWLYTDLLVDVLFLIDVLINANLAYYDRDVNLVTSHIKILKNYAKGWLLVDIVSCIPLQFILESQKNYSNLLKIGRASKLYKLVKIVRLVRMIKLVKNKTRIMRYMTSVFRVHIAIERLLWFLITFLMLVHLLACLWIFIGRLDIDTDSQNWIVMSNCLDFDNQRLYITSVYWATTTLTTVGYGDIKAHNTNERIFSSFAMVIGVFLYSYIIGSLTNLLSNLDLREAKLTRKLDIVNRLHREYPNIKENFYKKITSALEYNHKNSKLNIDFLLADLPLTLKSKLLIVIYQKELQSNTFFEDKKTDFVAFIAPLLKPVRIDDEDYVFKTGELALEMYFIISGEIQMTIRLETKEEVPFNTLIQRYYFGETDLLFSENKERTYNAKATKKSELLALSKSDFESMLKMFEEESVEIMNLAYSRNLRLKEKKTEAIELYLKSRAYRKLVSLPAHENDSPNKLGSKINIIPPDSSEDQKSRNMYNSVLENKLGKVESDIIWTKRKLKSLKSSVNEAQECLSKICEALI
jgi:CRP-like cAMP-binding protein